MGPGIDQQAAQVGTQGAPLMPSMESIQGISPIVEYLLQMLSGGGQQPKPSTTSQQVGPYRGPMPTQQLQQQMMGPRQPAPTQSEY